MSNPDIRARAPVPLDQCGAALATDIIGDRWTLLIIREAFYGVKRYDDFREDLGIPRSVLTTRLEALVEYGILERVPYREAGARTRSAYVLSKSGKALGLTLLALMQWGDEYLRGGRSAMKIVDKKTGQALRVGLVGEKERHYDLSEIALKPNS